MTTKILSTLLILGHLMSCQKEEQDSSKVKININDYIVREDSTIIHKRDLQISKKLRKYCYQIFKSDRFCFENVRYELNPRIRYLELSRIPKADIGKFLKEAQGLDTLRTLSLSRIPLDTLPNLTEFKNLISLTLNQLNLRDSIMLPNYVKKLSYLGIEKSKAKHIFFPKKCKIKTLNLYKNEINYLNESFYYLKDLEYLGLRENPLFDVIDLNRFPKLKEVNLCGTATRPHIRERIKKQYPHIKFDFCPDEIKVIFEDDEKVKQ